MKHVCPPIWLKWKISLSRLKKFNTTGVRYARMESQGIGTKFRFIRCTICCNYIVPNSIRPWNFTFKAGFDYKQISFSPVKLLYNIVPVFTHVKTSSRPIGCTWDCINHYNRTGEFFLYVYFVCILMFLDDFF